MARRTVSNREKFLLTLFGSLVAGCLIAMFAASLLGPTAQSVVLEYASDGFKITLGGFVGAISVMLGGGE